MGLLLAVVVHAANIQSLPRATTRASGRRPVLMWEAEISGWSPAPFQCGMLRASLPSLPPIFPWKTPASNACTASTSPSQR